jgi:hypothetical protein
MIMTKRIISIGLILGLLIAVLSGCSDKMNSDRFVSVLSKNGVSNMVISEPADKETGAKVTYGEHVISGNRIMFSLGSWGTEEGAIQYFTKQRNAFDFLLEGEGMEGNVEDKNSEEYSKAIAHMLFLDDDGLQSGLYSVMIREGNQVITINAIGDNEDVIKFADKVVKDLGYGE